MRASGRAVVLVVAAAISVGCVESSREVVREAQARGGGVTAELVTDAVAAVADRQGIDTVELRSVSVAFTQVALEVAVPADEPADGDADAEGEDTRDLAAYEYGTSGRFGVHGLGPAQEVMRSSTEAPLSASLFTLEDAGVERLDEMVDASLDAADLDAGYVAGATIARPPAGGAPQTVVAVTDGRRTVDVVLGPDAAVVEVRS